MKLDIYILNGSGWRRHADAIMRVEEGTYEQGRRDSRDYFSAMIERPRSVCLVAITNSEIAGFCFGASLEDFPEVRGIRADANWGQGNTLYSADLTVAPDYRGKGIGLRLKEEQIRHARSYGYRYITGRNRVGLADPMWRLNQKVGAYHVQLLRDSYIDGPDPRDAIYYRIDLTE